MRKIFSLFTAILFAGSMMATDPVTVKSTFTKATAPAENAVTDLEGVVTWSIATEVGAGTPSYTTGKNSQIECLKFGSKAAEYFSKVTLSTNYYEDYNVKSVTLYVLNNGKKTGTLTVKQGETTIGTDSKEFGAAWTALTATGVTGNGGTLEVSYEVAQASYWSYIEVQYEIPQGGGEQEGTVKTVYCKVTQGWWTVDGAATGIYAYADGNVENAAWPGVRMEAVEGEADLWKADIDTAAYSSIIFTRVNASGDIANWGAQTEDLEVPADKDLYTITSATAQWIGEGNKVTGEWSVYGEEPIVEPAKFYITGDSALVVNAGLDKEQAWNPAAIKSTETSYKLNLAAGDYMLKITLNGTWDEGKVKGFDALTTVADGLTKGEGEAYDNICFTLAEAGEVNVHYDGEFFFLNGDFYVAPVEVHYYFKNNWGGEEWTWKEITNEEGYYMLGPVAVGGEGVNFHTAMTDDAPFITWAEISAFDASYDPAVIGAGDTVLFFFDPEEVNTYTGANGLSAQITYKYVAPEAPAKFYITGDSALVVNAGLDKEQAWNPAAIKSDAVSYKLNLAAGDYMLKITLDGTWGEGKVKGYDALTTVADGLTKGEGEAYDNICFTLTEAGEVSVHYDGEFFFLNGNFYVAPVVVKYYLKNNWGGESWTWKEMTDLGDGTYMLYNVVVGGEGVNRNTAESDEGASWSAWADIETYDALYAPATIGALDTVVIYFDPEAVNSYTGANGMSAQILGKYVAPVYRLENGYYMLGSAQGWDVANLDAEDKFAVNPNDDAEYVLTATLAENQAFKVVYVENDAIKTYYPEGTDNNYAVDAAHAGVKDIYFRPDGQGGDDWYYRCIYVLPTSGTAIDKVAGEAKAVKILKNGMLIIEKNGVKYNVLGVRL